MKNYLLLIPLVFVSCAQLSSEKPSLVLKHDADVEINGQVRKAKANEQIEVQDGETLKISAPGKASLLVFHSSKSMNSEVDLPGISELVLNERLNIELNKKLDTLMPQIQEVQQLILKEDYSNAVSKVRDLKNTFPGVAYLSFLESACYQVQGRNTEALRVLSEGLAIHPESLEGNAMYRSLSGREVR